MTRPVRWDGAGDVAASHHATITNRQAAEFGITPSIRRRARREGLVASVAPRVLAFNGAPATWRQRLAAATQTASGHPIASFRAAAALHRVDGFADETVEVSGGRGAKVRMDGVVVHQLSVPIPPEDIVKIDGIRCTSLARTLVDVASVIGPRQLERALDDFERRGFSLTWLEHVANRLHRPGQRGTKAVLAEIRRRRQRGRVRGSWFEKLIGECIASPAIPTIVEQHEIFDSDGAFICRVDLAIPGVMVAIECHSRAFHTGDHAEIVDQRRENRAILGGIL